MRVCSPQFFPQEVDFADNEINDWGKTWGDHQHKRTICWLWKKDVNKPIRSLFRGALSRLPPLPSPANPPWLASLPSRCFSRFPAGIQLNQRPIFLWGARKVALRFFKSRRSEGRKIKTIFMTKQNSEYMKRSELFADVLRNDPEAIIVWAESEIQAYKDLIKILEKDRIKNKAKSNIAKLNKQIGKF